MYDYHPQAIPAPYNHSNIDSDEVLFYTEGDFMSRNHIDLMDFTFILAELFTDLILAQWKEALAKIHRRICGNDRSFQTTENYRRSDESGR